MKIIKLIFLVILFSNISTAKTNAEDLFEEYQSQKDCTKENAEYRYIHNSEAKEDRYCIDNQKNIYLFVDDVKKNWTGITISGLGAIRLGNLNESEVTKGNNCLLGTNIQCLSTVVYTTTQYKVDGNYLKKFWRREINGSKGKIYSNTIGIHKNAKDELINKAVESNDIAIENYLEGNNAKAATYSLSGFKWYPNQMSIYFYSASNAVEEGYLETALEWIDLLIDNQSSLVYGHPQTLLTEPDYFNLRGIIKVQLQMAKKDYCSDFKKAVELDNKKNKRFNEFKC